MALRIFYIVIALAAGFLIYDIYKLSSGYGKLDEVPETYSLGPEDADVTVVEFLDYGCTYCRDIHPVIISAVVKDKNVRYVPRPLPSQNPESVHAAILAYTAGMQGKFLEMHDGLMKNYRVLDEATIFELSEQAGIDTDRMDTDVKTGEVVDRINENGALFKKIGGQQTPTFVINNDVIFVPEGRMPTVDDFLNMFDEARKAL